MARGISRRHRATLDLVRLIHGQGDEALEAIRRGEAQ